MNCAGIVLRTDGNKLGIRDIEPEAWRRSLDVNLTSVFLCARAVIPIMETRAWGRIVTISSQGGRTGGAFSSVDYGAAKAGVIGFSRTLAMEVGTHGITVNCVAPGRVKSPMTAHGAEQAQNETFLARLPSPAWRTPQKLPRPWRFCAHRRRDTSLGQRLTSMAAGSWLDCPPRRSEARHRGLTPFTNVSR